MRQGTTTTTTIAAGMLLIASLAAGCDRHEGRAGDTSGTATGAGAAVPAAPAPRNEMAPSPAAKSVIRPAVSEAPEPPPLETERLTISFADRGLTLSDDARARLDALADSRTMRAGGPIVLRGHSDSRGHDGDNLIASRKRAEAVRAYLESKGVPRARITIIALGEARPIAPNAHADGSDDPAGRARNRRVEIEVQPPAPPPGQSGDPG
ncbi:MAG TPA: OmpA family protein [Sphingomonadaceae bacterium]|nr:OmpA family protein [Sphingomonadaceae bacterium]